MDDSWQVQLVGWGQEPNTTRTNWLLLRSFSISSLSLRFCSVTKSSVSVITNALIIFNCPLAERSQKSLLSNSVHSYQACHHVSLNFVLMLTCSASLYHSISISLELTSDAGGFLKLIQQSDCVWVRQDINWTPNLFIGRKNGNCKRNVGLLSGYRTKYFISDISAA